MWKEKYSSYPWGSGSNGKGAMYLHACLFTLNISLQLLRQATTEQWKYSKQVFNSFCSVSLLTDDLLATETGNAVYSDPHNRVAPHGNLCRTLMWVWLMYLNFLRTDDPIIRRTDSGPLLGTSHIVKPHTRQSYCYSLFLLYNLILSHIRTNSSKNLPNWKSELCVPYLYAVVLKIRECF